MESPAEKTGSVRQGPEHSRLTIDCNGRHCESSALAAKGRSWRNAVDKYRENLCKSWMAVSWPKFSCPVSGGSILSRAKWAKVSVAFKFGLGDGVYEGAEEHFWEGPAFCLCFSSLVSVCRMPEEIARLPRQCKRISSADGAYSANSRTSSTRQIFGRRVGAMSFLPLGK
jgi:hypothetical protein